MDQKEAREIRQRVLADSLEVLASIEWELQLLRDAGEPLSKEFVDKFAKIADQIRRDTKPKTGDQDLTDDEEEAATDIPLTKLKLIS